MYAVALDDVGTKVSLDKLPLTAPTWVIETSAGNFQVGYRFTYPTDRGAALLQDLRQRVQPRRVRRLTRWFPNRTPPQLVLQWGLEWRPGDGSRAGTAARAG